jgi:hypothetical protein
MRKINWICRTGQRWKLVVFLFLMAVEFAMLAILTAQYNGRLTSLEHFVDKVSLALMFTAVGAIALLWLALVFRCPHCQANVGWYVMTKLPAATWFTIFLTLSSCPKCNDNTAAC